MSLLGNDVSKILIKIQNGDEHSKNVLFETTYSHLKGIVTRYLYNKNDVEDVLMETYLKVFRYIHAFKPTEDGYNWIYKIMQNIAYDFNKAHKREILTNEWNSSVYERDIEELIAANDAVRRWLEPYPVRERKMIYLRFWEDRKIKEIAQILGMGKSNVHKQIKKFEKEIMENELKGVEKSSKKQVY